MDAVNGDIRQKPDAKSGLPADIIAECAGQKYLFYIGVGDFETMLKKMNACAYGGFGELYFADVPLGQIHCGCMAMIGKDKDRAFVFTLGMFMAHFG